MGSAIRYPVKSNTRELTKICGSFRPAGTGAVTNVQGKGFSVARTSVGLYTVTFNEKFNQLHHFSGGARSADARPLNVTGGDYVANSKTLQIRVSEGVRGEMALDLGSAREISSNDIGNLAAHGGILATDSTPTYERINGATDKGLRVLWAASNSDEIQFSPVPMLPSMNGANDISVHLLAVMSGTTDTPTIDVQVFDAVGDTEMGSATAALSDTLAEVSATIASANISGHPTGFLNISLVPGAHTTDTITMYAAWLEWATLVDLGADADNVISFEAAFRNHA